MNDLLCSADAGKVTLVVLLDLSAAFDVIDHTTLLTRLQMEVGIGGSALQWFHSYLSDRTQRVMVNQASSVTVPLLCGVPQGSVLGPVLFSIYTSQLGPLIEKHNVNRKMFADDTELYFSFSTDSESVREAVCAVEDCCLEVKSWMLRNKLKLNDEKTEAMLCGSKLSLSKVSLDSIQVEAPEEEDFMDVSLNISIEPNAHFSKTLPYQPTHLRTMDYVIITVSYLGIMGNLVSLMVWRTHKTYNPVIFLFKYLAVVDIQQLVSISFWRIFVLFRRYSPTTLILQCFHSVRAQNLLGQAFLAHDTIDSSVSLYRSVQTSRVYNGTLLTRCQNHDVVLPQLCIFASLHLCLYHVVRAMDWHRPKAVESVHEL
ncbi:hypothetical protein C0Q70_15953 [Pomacea canaliculata]|uniref:Reverse transcriptase domain-containing protein n=1 Tax=Pomacea canaliculata TaxID=400727 RepID=A0A2T7NNE2_POMCA|nr:hypothetical protein C0Q70_15953 [Pomacea canaliculata]